MDSGIKGGDELHAVLMSDEDTMREGYGNTGPARDLEVIMIAGQHRARAVKAACEHGFDPQQAIWPCYLYRQCE